MGEKREDRWISLLLSFENVFLFSKMTKCVSDRAISEASSVIIIFLFKVFFNSLHMPTLSYIKKEV